MDCFADDSELMFKINPHPSKWFSSGCCVLASTHSASHMPPKAHITKKRRLAFCANRLLSLIFYGGAEGDRLPDLMTASQSKSI